MRISGYFKEVPLKTVRAIARDVSVPYSMETSGTPASTFRQQLAEVGWVYTTALRRLSSSKMGAK
jgi:hypothetical protein